MTEASEPLPERTKRPLKEFGHQVAVCQTFSIARLYGWQIAVGADDVGCPLALTAFGLKPVTDGFSCGKMCAGMYTETVEAGARTESEVPKFSFEKFKYILAAPTDRCGFEPQVILVYGNSAQVMRLVAAALWKSGGYIHSRFSGRLDCADSVIETMQTDKPQVILPCYGDRVFGSTQDHEMAFAFPFRLSADIVEGLEGTHKGGVRYPIPSYLRFKPQFPEHYYSLFKEWESGESK
jgi:uncharacterized protein (DUF169 family)